MTEYGQINQPRLARDWQTSAPSPSGLLASWVIHLIWDREETVKKGKSSLFGVTEGEGFEDSWLVFAIACIPIWFLSVAYCFTVFSWFCLISFFTSLLNGSEISRVLNKNNWLVYTELFPFSISPIFPLLILRRDEDSESSASWTWRCGFVLILGPRNNMWRKSKAQRFWLIKDLLKKVLVYILVSISIVQRFCELCGRNIYNWFSLSCS